MKFSIKSRSEDLFILSIWGAICLVLGVLPLVPLSAAAKEGAGDPPIRKLHYMSGVIFPSPSEGDQLLPPELGGSQSLPSTHPPTSD